jgi:hypothetical protein
MWMILGEYENTRIYHCTSLVWSNQGRQIECAYRSYGEYETGMINENMQFAKATQYFIKIEFVFWNLNREFKKEW